jgi:hypothetical protein
MDFLHFIGQVANIPGNERHHGVLRGLEKTIYSRRNL